MEVELRNLQEKGLPLELIRQAATLASEMVAATPGLQAPDALTLVFVDDARIQDVNRRFLGPDCPTDVIAFEAEQEGHRRVGEVIISTETAARQASEYGSDLATELAWLVAHGVLHAAGMDDTTQERREQMLALQTQVLERMGLEPRP